MIIHLTEAEIADARFHAKRKNDENRRKGRRHHYGETGYREVDHFNGNCGEIAVAKILGLKWDGWADSFNDKPDLPPDWHVRATDHPRGRLIVHEPEYDEDGICVREKPGRYVLALVADLPAVDVAGYLESGNARRKKWWKDPKGGRPAYFIWRSDLKPMPL